MMVSCARLIEDYLTGEVETISTTVMVTTSSAIPVPIPQHLIPSGMLGLRGRHVLRNVDQVRGDELATALGTVVLVNHHKADLATKVHARGVGVLGHLGQLAPLLADLELNLEAATAMAVTALAILRKTEPATLVLVITSAAVIFNSWVSDIASLRTVGALKEWSDST